MRKATLRLGRLSGVIAAGVAIVATGSGVMAASYSTFNGKTESAANGWKSGTLELTDNDGGNTAMFTADQSQLKGERCIKVTSSGTYPGVVRIYSKDFAQTGGLADHANITITMGTTPTNNTFGDCTSFAATTVFSTSTLTVLGAKTTWATGIDTGWTTPSNNTSETRTFKISWSYDDTVPQNQTAQNTFVWEAQTINNT